MSKNIVDFWKLKCAVLTITGKLNQDATENQFAQIRGKGGHRYVYSLLLYVNGAINVFFEMRSTQHGRIGLTGLLE